jgi:hypothetical protein
MMKSRVILRSGVYFLVTHQAAADIAAKIQAIPENATSIGIAVVDESDAPQGLLSVNPRDIEAVLVC